MSIGVPILGTVSKKCKVEQVDKHRFKITLTEGLNRQIRRMCEHLNYDVRQLERYRIMNIHLDMPIGKWRHLNKGEMDELNKLLKGSSKTK